jgi:DNA-binding HxlR family transcriptional regulator
MLDDRVPGSPIAVELLSGIATSRSELCFPTDIQTVAVVHWKAQLTYAVQVSTTDAVSKASSGPPIPSTAETPNTAETPRTPTHTTTQTTPPPPVVAYELSVMASQPLRPRPCSVAASLQILGERWSLLAIREMSYGVHRFEQITNYTGASRDILADRLRKLEAAGVVERRQYSEHPPRFEYHLTEAGEALRPVLMALSQWGSKWANGRPTAILSHECGHSLEVDYICRHCGEPITKASTRILPPPSRAAGR